MIFLVIVLVVGILSGATAAVAGFGSFALLIAVATVGVITGTLFGERLLFGLSPRVFQRLIAILIGALGVWVIASTLK